MHNKLIRELESLVDDADTKCALSYSDHRYLAGRRDGLHHAKVVVSNRLRKEWCPSFPELQHGNID